jgi:hypothetical protein
MLRDRPFVTPKAARHQARAVWAFVIVSRVVNVFEEMIKRVSDGSRSTVASTKSVPSMFDTKRNVMALSE